MMKCQICGKPAEKLVKVLRMGPAGFRKYDACGKCQASKNASIKTPAGRA